VYFDFKRENSVHLKANRIFSLCLFPASLRGFFSKNNFKKSVVIPAFFVDNIKNNCQDKRITDDFILKMAQRSETAYGNTRFVLPRKRQTYIVTSTKRV
jgi:hypothetical protein